ncbi:tol-pal system-associated acyl-CoA thioesterase [Paremcibacter congregatus]|uniref:tol-pal system-associated acyl-CoA thioesterase n=1 Tax=Paremcibacter congregatus TaxID=2043170 RepID=UPI0030EDEE05|tara:strand:- start:592 stop:1053 length:462 start_codon:yes stop_codon:yes gene_type:complete
MAELSPHSGIIKDREHILPLRVYYEDTDAGGIVYYANYLKYMERGRSDMLRGLSINQADMLKFLDPDDIKFVVIRAEVDYVKPARLDDEITVHTSVSELGNASLVMTQDVRRDGEVLARGVVKAAALNQNDRPARLPGDVRDKLKKIVKVEDS